MVPNSAAQILTSAPTDAAWFTNAPDSQRTWTWVPQQYGESPFTAGPVLGADSVLQPWRAAHTCGACGWPCTLWCSRAGALADALVLLGHQLTQAMKPPALNLNQRQATVLTWDLRYLCTSISSPQIAWVKFFCPSPRQMKQIKTRQKQLHPFLGAAATVLRDCTFYIPG